MAKAQAAEATAAGDVMLREDALRAKAKAEEVELQKRQLETQLKQAHEQLASEKAKADAAAESLERAELLAHRKVYTACRPKQPPRPPRSPP